MIYISTGGFKEQSAYESAKQLIESGVISIELSGGTYSSNLLDDLKTLTSVRKFQVHNYFPPAERPFVFNLASQNPEIRKISVNHVKTAIRWALELDHDRYSFHAGYLLDPDPQELGKRIARRVLFDRQDGMRVFLDEVNGLAGFAEKEGVELLIENNVLSAGNYREFGNDPFLAATPEEAQYIMQNTPDNVSLLVDVAHLKVSAQTLGFDPEEMFRKCAPWIRAYHLSDNDGTRDSNEPIHENSWFWPHLKKNLDYYTLEIYGVSPDQFGEQIQMTERFLSSST